MSEDIYIVAGGTCEVNLDVVGEYAISCVAITGRLAITVLDSSSDYVTYIVDETTGSTDSKKASLTIRSTVAQAVIPFICRSVCEQKDDGLFYYKYAITDCSERMGYLLGIKSLPTKAGEQFHAAPSINGPTFFQVVCDKLAGCGTVTANSYVVNNMFQISGPTYVGDISNVTFSIRGVYNEEIEFGEDLLWHFKLIKLPPKKQGQKSQNQNAVSRMVHQYTKSSK